MISNGTLDLVFGVFVGSFATLFVMVAFTVGVTIIVDKIRERRAARRLEELLPRDPQPGEVERGPLYSGFGSMVARTIERATTK